MKQSKKINNWRKYMAMALAMSIVATPMVSGSTAMAAQKAAAKSVKVSVQNNAKVIVVGKKYKLSYKLTPAASKEKVTYTSSNTDVATVAKGVVTPKKTGNVTITAKTANGKKSSVQLLAVNKNGVTGWQSRVDKMLAANNVTNITIKELSAEKNYIIEDGNYAKKTLTVDAPYSDVENHGVFKTVVVKDVKDGTWREFAKDNNIRVEDKDITMIVDKNASVKNLNFTAKNANIKLQSEGSIAKVAVGGADAKIDVVANGKVEKIVLNSKADVVISGNAEKVQLEVGKNAAGAKIESSVKVEAKVGAAAEVKLLKGAEGSALEKTSSDVKVEVKNDTESKVEIGTAGSDNKESVDAGKDSATTTPGGGGSAGGGGSTGGGTVTDTTATVTGVASNNGKTATYTLPADLDNLKSVKVKVSAGTLSKDYSVDGTILTYVKKLLADESGYITLWEGLTSFETSLSVGGSKVKIEGTDTPSKKKVTFDGIEFEVNVLKDTNSITVKKANGTSAYTLSKTNRNILTITADNNTNVSSLVSFEITY